VVFGRLTQAIPDLRQSGFPAAIGKKPIGTNAHHAFGQDLHEKAAQEFVTVE